ncbi:MAG: hypothetical protein HYU25_14900 [Candidatus Rokubacteria bacterium]|nr:hypothetical protein [Candidatus Rokubacteria bacterium]
MSRTLALTVALLTGVAACAQLTTTEQRVFQGPTAQEIWTAGVVLVTGREPTFDEKHQWEIQIDRRISQYLNQHPAIANSADVQIFQFVRQVTVGMTKEQVVILLGAPVVATKDTAEIEKLARRYWPLIKPKNVTEAWLYPQGWRLYFSETKVVDITQYAERFQ